VAPRAAPGDRSASAPLLELEGIEAAYGAFKALFGVTFAVQQGSVVTLLGHNGAGKTTVARVASNLIVPTKGVVRFDGIDVTGWPTWKMARLGVAHAVEGRSVFASLTVEENLLLAFGRSGTEALERAYTSFPRLGERRRQEAGTLSGGEQRMLSLARVMADPPRLLIADELSLGLAPVVVDEVYRTLAEIRDAGTTLLVVEQQVHRALGLADTVVVLGNGVVRFAGPVADLGDLASELLPA
jgi:branched-chain amino acid transport system ATP-binding protein